MITYIYETIPQGADEKSERFEWKQSIHDEALVTHPRTGVPVRRIVSGGFGYTSTGGKDERVHCCRGSCSC
ncbi:MAG: zinc ribbon domain-containing protein [Verrucomicrobiota bacterium]|nr:zinc ribbon domain-containing protein [Verrucomicrobiota bacterium]